MSRNTEGLLKGQVGQWKNQPTCTIRVPRKFKKILTDLARGLDQDCPIAPLSSFPLEELIRIQSELPELIDRRKRLARDKLVTDNLNLARSIAHRIANHPYCPFPYEDLEQQAFLALTVASERFESRRGNKFSTFATPIIRGRLLHYIRDAGTSIKVPRAYYELYFQAIKLERRLGSLEAAAAHLKMPIEKLQEAYRSVESCYQSSGIAEGTDWRSPSRVGLPPAIGVKWSAISPEESQEIKAWLSGGRVSPARLRSLLINLPLDAVAR